MTSEELVREYLVGAEIAIYHDFKIVNLSTVGDLVQFEEKSACGYNTQFHQIPLLDIVAWVYGKAGAAT